MISRAVGAVKGPAGESQRLPPRSYALVCPGPRGHSPLAMRDAWLEWLSAMPPRERDAAVEGWLGLGRHGHTPPADGLIGYHPSGVAPIVRALAEVPVVADDVFVDLGAGLGKVVLLTRFLTGATSRGIEIQPALVEGARVRAGALGIDAAFAHGDVREADLDDGTVFFLYTPCTGVALDAVLERLHAVARRRAIVVCALGFDIARRHTWLVPRPVDAFWLTMYDSVVPGVAPRPRFESVLRGAAAEAIALEHVGR